MPKEIPFNVIASVGIDEDHQEFVKEYKEILIQFSKEFPFFRSYCHESAIKYKFPRSYNKILGPSLLPTSNLWKYTLPNICVLDIDVWLTTPFSINNYVTPGQIRFWEAKGIAPEKDRILKDPYGKLFFRSGGISPDKWIQHSAYYMTNKVDFEDFMKHQIEVYPKLYAVLEKAEVTSELPNFSPWFAEMYSASFAAIQKDMDVVYFGPNFHTGNGCYDNPYFNSTFLHFFIGGKDGRYWSKFWKFHFPFTDKEWVALKAAKKELDEEVDLKEFTNTRFILRKLLEHENLFNCYRDMRDIDYNDVDSLPDHDTVNCEYCKRMINQW